MSRNNALLGILGWLSVALVSPSFAESTEDGGAFPEGSDKLVAHLQTLLPQLSIETVYALPIKGMYGVEVRGGQTLYGTADGEYLFSGDLYRLSDEVVNLAESRRAIKRKAALDAVPLKDMVVFSPVGETRAHVNVFTDVDCGYCRKLHQEMAQLNAMGIEVRYLAYPRAGLGTPTYDKIVSAWCSDDPQGAITALKSGQNVPPKQCDNPVARQYQLGQSVGITGTPAIITAQGQLLPGYMPAADLAAAIGLE